MGHAIGSRILGFTALLRGTTAVTPWLHCSAPTDNRSDPVASLLCSDGQPQ